MPYKNPPPLFSTWAHIKSRAKRGGLPLCAEWHVFKQFLADVGEKPEGKILIALDRSIGYCKGNVSWETEQTKVSARKDFRPSLGHPLYTVWRGMIARCTDPNIPAWKDYGGRGISVCERWQGSFHAFVDDMGERPRGYTLDRKDNNGNYEPGNCRWASRAEQQANRRVNRMITFNGETLCASEWARRLGLKPDTILERIERGIPLEKALTSQRFHDRSGLAIGWKYGRGAGNR